MPMLRNPPHYYQEVTQLTTKTVFFRWSRSVLPFLTGTLAVVAFFSGVLALPQMWQNYSALQQRERTLDQFTTEAEGLLKEMHRTIQVSEEQTRRLKSLAAYSIDPKTGFAIVDYDQILRKK